MKVELVYIESGNEFIQQCEVEGNSTVEQVILSSDLLKRCPHLSLPSMNVGIFSVPVDLHVRVNEGDRIEVYRDLLMDPMQARRLRAQVK